MSAHEDHPLFCRVCRFALDRWTDSTGVLRLRHPSSVLNHHHRLGVAEHPPVAVPIVELAEPIMICDFDSAVPALWIYRAQRYVSTEREITAVTVAAEDYRQQHRAARVRGVRTGLSTTSDFGQTWAACQGCAEVIEGGNALELVARVVDALPGRAVNTDRKLRAVRGALIDQFEAFLATRRPGRGRLEPGHYPHGRW